MIGETLYVNEESVRKQLTLDKSVYNWLQQGESEAMTKGIKAYEALMFVSDEHRDSIDEIEDMVDEQLESLTDSSLPDQLKKIKNSSGTIDLADQDADRVNIHLPVTAERELSSWGLGRDIEEAVLELSASAFEDRMDRIECKRELISYIQDGKDPEHSVASAVVEGESNYYRYIQNSHTCIPEVESEERSLAEMTISQLRQMDHTKSGDGFSQKEREKRIQALQNAVENEVQKEDVDEYDWDRDRIAEEAEEAFDVTEVTAEKYAEQIDIDWIDLVKIETKALAEAGVSQISADVFSYGDLDSQLRRRIWNKYDSMSLSRQVMQDEDLLVNSKISRERAEEIVEEILDGYNTSLYMDSGKDAHKKTAKKFQELVEKHYGDLLEEE